MFSFNSWIGHFNIIAQLYHYLNVIHFYSVKNRVFKTDNPIIIFNLFRMSAGTIPPPLIITSEIAKKKSVPWNCLFELEAKDPSYFIYYTINAERPATFDLPGVYKKMNPKQRNTLLYKSPFWLMSGKRTIKARVPNGQKFTKTKDLSASAFLVP